MNRSPDKYRNLNSERLMKKIRYTNQQMNVVKQFINNPSASFVDVQNIHSKRQNNLVKSIERNSPGKSISMCQSKYRYRPNKH